MLKLNVEEGEKNKQNTFFYSGLCGVSIRYTGCFLKDDMAINSKILQLDG